MFKNPFPIGYQFYSKEGLATIIEFQEFDWDYKVRVIAPNKFVNYYYMCHAEIVDCKPYANWGLLWKGD